MSDYLIEHARENIWCAPDQDYQSIFKPYKLSPERGSRRTQRVEWQTVPLPNQEDTFYVYQIGNVHPGLLGLFPKNGRWITASDHCNIQSMIIDIYTMMGINLPRTEVWFAVMYDRNIIMAIKAQPEDGVDLETTDVFVRFYSNAFFESVRSNNLPSSDPSIPIPPLSESWMDNVTGNRAAGRPGLVRVEGKRLNDRSELSLMNARLAALNAQGFGHAYAFYNGVKVSDFSQGYYTAARFQKGDYAEIVFDGSIAQVVDFPVAGLKTFDSLKDHVRKYLLHRSNQWVDYIQYHDDIDTFLYVPLANNRHEGVFYHRNSPISMSMVTHQDYAIPVAFVAGYRHAIASMSDPNAFVVRLHIRYGGFQRPLVNEHQRIKELYKLKEPDRLLAMVGTSSSLECWKAANLENELYPSFMGGAVPPSSLADIEMAYGYNAISKLVADSPLRYRDSGGQRVVDLPIGLWRRATIFEYNAAGHLLGWYPALGQPVWVCKNADCDFIEGRIGTGSAYLNTVYNQQSVVLDPNYDYAMFKVQFWGGKPGDDWMPAVEGEDYVIIDGTLHWNIDLNNWYTAVRCNSHFLTYAIDVDGRDGLMVFSVQANEDDEYAPPNRVLPIPPGKLDIWMNGRALIRNIDYFVKWPQIVVCNKEFIANTPTQRFVIRGTGIPRLVDGEWVEESPSDTGFVQYGKLSHNNYYNVRDDKVQRVVVRGAVYLPDELWWAENQYGVTNPDINNGDPYAVEEVIVPISQYTERGTYFLRDRSLARDKEVQDYMTTKLPQPTEPNANPIPEQYEIFSPFCSKIMHDLNDGNLVIEGIDNFSYPNERLSEWLKDYLYLLDYEPTKKGLDERYVNIHPHELYTVVTMNVWHHHFLRRVVKVFLDDKVELSKFIAVSDSFVPIVPPRD